MSKVIKGGLLAVGILFTAGLAAFAAPAIFATMTAWSVATTLATGAFLSGISAQLSGSRKGQRPNVSVEYSGTVEPRRLLYGFNRVSGMHTIPPVTTGTNNKYLHKLLTIAGHQCNAISNVYFDQVQVGTRTAISGTADDGKVTTGAYANKAWVRAYLGTSGQTADFILDTALTLWTSNHRGRGVTYVAMQKEVDETVWKTGETGDQFDVEGKLCYDPRLDTSPGANPTSATYQVYTRNPVLQIADYLIDDVLGLGELPARIDWNMVVDAADICDELVAVPTASTQPRYRSDQALLTSTPYEDNIRALAAACLGSVLYSGGKWRIRAGAWETPSFEITDADVIGPLDLETAYQYREGWNGVRGSFIDPNNNYQLNEFPPVQDASYVTADGRSAFRDTQFDSSNNVYDAQRKAIYLTRKSRNSEVATIPCGMSLWKVRPGDTGIATISELNWTNQQIRCEGWGFTPDGTVGLRVRKENSADWNDPIEADYVTPTNISTPTPVSYTPDAPVGLAATSIAGSIAFTITPPALMPSAAVYELWEYTASTPFASATKIWEGVATATSIAKADTTTRYYWVRVRMPDGTTGPTYPASTGTSGAAGTGGAAGISAFLTNEAHTLPADSAGNVSSYAGATGTFKVYSGASDVSSSFSLSTQANPQTLTVSYASQDYTVTAGFDAGEANASLTIRATGSGAYSGVIIDKVFSLAKSVAGSNGSNGTNGTNGTNGSNGANGADAKLLYVISDRQTIAYDGAGSPTPSTQTTTFTAQKLNTTATVSWTLTDLEGNALTPATYLSATTGDSTTITRSNFDAGIAVNSSKGLIITGTLTDGVTLSDKVSVLKVQAGAAGTNGSNGTNGTNGTNGANGTDGLNNATVLLYKRSATAPAVPTTTSTYTFATGVLTGHDNGWTQAVPTTDGNPLYVTLAVASGTGATDTIATGEWVTPTILATDGAPGGSQAVLWNATISDSSVSGTSEVTIASISSPSIASGGVIRLTPGAINATGAPVTNTTLTIRIKIGGTTVASVQLIFDSAGGLASAEDTTDMINTIANSWSGVQTLSVTRQRSSGTATGLAYDFPLIIEQVS